MDRSHAFDLSYMKYRIPFLLYFMGVLSSLGVAAAPAKPNFLLIIADDFTFSDVGCYGGQAYTPTIDRLAQEGMRFTRCFQAAPVCSATRHALYTGMYPVKTISTILIPPWPCPPMRDQTNMTPEQRTIGSSSTHPNPIFSLPLRMIMSRNINALMLRS